MDSLILERPTLVATKPKPRRLMSFVTVAPEPHVASLAEDTTSQVTAIAPTPTDKVKPGLAAKSAVGVTWKGIAIAAGISAAPLAIKFLLRPRSKGRNIALSMTTSIISSLPWNYLFNIRPTLLYWGATVDEVKQTLPGDELVPEPQMTTTYATTINAPPAQVWPWLAQMGQGRGGLYSYEALENLMHLDMHNADRIIPELQNLKVGDEVRLTPTDALALEVATLEPERTLVLCNPNLHHGEGKAGNYFKAEMNVSWAFILEPVGGYATRLLVRLHMGYQPNLPTVLAVHLMQEPAQFIMLRKMMLGIKQRVERQHEEIAG